jgi:hypothetical protein
LVKIECAEEARYCGDINVMIALAECKRKHTIMSTANPCVWRDSGGSRAHDQYLLP